MNQLVLEMFSHRCAIIYFETIRVLFRIRFIGIYKEEIMMDIEKIIKEVQDAIRSQKAASGPIGPNQSRSQRHERSQEGMRRCQAHAGKEEHARYSGGTEPMALTRRTERQVPRRHPRMLGSSGASG